MGRRVLVTGVSRDLGGRLARQLSLDPAIERVIGVDVLPPSRDIGSVEFVRVDIRNPVIAKVIAGRDVDTVVHMSVEAVSGRGARAAMKEHNVIGSMQLLAACQRAPGLERLVVKSSTAVYGASSRDPAMFTEEIGAKRQPRGGYPKDVVEVEGYVRGFARRRPDVVVTMLRAANSIGPTINTPLTSYFRLPVLPKPLGFDARLQFVHERDLLAVLGQATLAGVHGTFNIAGAGVVMLSQAIRRLGKPILPVPGFALDSVGSVLSQVGLAGISPDLTGLLTFGRGVDTTRMRDVLGFRPAYTTESAFDDFAATVPSATVGVGTPGTRDGDG